MKIDEKMNGGPLPFDKSKCPACLRKYRFVLGLGNKLPNGDYLCHAWSPIDKAKNPAATFIFNPDKEPGKYKIIFEPHSVAYLSKNTIVSPLDCLFGDELKEKLYEMFEDGYAAWN